jgi:glycosyltransferase involved in cell wall biosynthesis
MNEPVDILLATYQGSAFLEEQLHSIFNQTYPYLHVWVRDDGSTDETGTILNRWAEKYSTQMTLLASSNQLGPKGNFAELMKHSQAPYVMFADQDDQWHLDKVALSLTHLKQLEAHDGSQTPLLVHTDLTVANNDLSLIAPSFWNYSGLNPKHITLNRLITQNVLTGCTFLMNRSLVDLALPIPEAAIMHDWWIGLVASCLGKIEYINQATLLYRQHHANDVGARSYRLWNYMTQPRRPSNRRFNRTFQQAQAFLIQYSKQITPAQQVLLQNYIKLNHLPFFKQKREILKQRFFKQGFLRNLKHFFTKYR